MLLDRKTIVGINQTLFELCCLNRWSDVISSERYVELSKQTLNCAITFFIAHRLKHEGWEIDFTLFPKIALTRLFEKRVIADIKESHIRNLAAYGISKDAINNKIWQDIRESTSESFEKFILVDKNCIEMQIFNLSRKMATLLELYEISPWIIEKSIIQEKEQEILDELRGYNVFGIPFEEMLIKDSIEHKIFVRISSLRNKMRWAICPRIVECSVLGHQMDTAIFAYIDSMSLRPDDEQRATRLFWIGIFHDFSEAFTGDMRSPVKDAIKGLRTATERIDMDTLERHVFSMLPKHMADALRGVMIYDDSNKDLNPYATIADHRSADVECWRQLIAGSHSPYFKNIILSSYKKKESFPTASRLMVEYLFESLAGIS